MNKHRLSQHIRIIILIAVAALFVGAGPAQASVCTLADHIRSANTNTAVGFCPAGTSHDVITITQDITLTEPLPPVTGTITIEGGGHTISGGGEYRIFDVDGGRLTLKDLTLTEGFSEEHGGALLMRNGARVTVNDSTFLKNVGKWGGAVAVYLGEPQLNVQNSRFIENRATFEAGALLHVSGKVEINGSVFINNDGNAVGGAIFAPTGDQLTVTNSTFIGNSAGRGGAVASGGPARLTHVTMVGNRASLLEGGHAIWISERNSRFDLYNSIIANDKDGAACVGPINGNSGNLIEDGSCAPAVTGDPMIIEASEPSAHFALHDLSPAVDAADPQHCLDFDQVGTARPKGNGCDIGAIESTTAVAAPTAVPEVCPLPDQIIAANTDAPVGNCPAGSGADTIILLRDFTLSAKLPPITSEITIEGEGYTISGDERFRIFNVDGGTLTISDVTLTEGYASEGGAIRLVNGARVNAENVRFTNNEAANGGAIATASYSVRLDVKNSSFVDNVSNGTGGALKLHGGIINISGSSFQGNSAYYSGGAIHSRDGRVSIANSTLHANTAASGGGIYNGGAQTTLTHLTLMNNVAHEIYGAGLFKEAGLVYLRNSVIAGSGFGDDCYGRLDQNRGNFSEDGTCTTSDGGDPALDDLRGSPGYHAIKDVSPLVDAADAEFCSDTDQIGTARPQGGGCDIGAFESTTARAAQRITVQASADCELADQIIAANTDAPAGNCPAGNGADHIALTKNITLTAPLPIITSEVTIDGKGHTIDGDNRFRIFHVQRATAAFKNLTLINGNAQGEDGGAIYAHLTSDIVISNVTFRNNRAKSGGAVAAIGSDIGVYNSRFFDNSATRKGGGLWVLAGCPSVSNCRFRRNTSTAKTDYYRAYEDAGTPSDCIPGGTGGSFYSDT